MHLSYAVGILLFACIAHASESVAPIPFSVRAVLPMPSWTCQASGWSCMDCNTRQYCNGPNDREYRITCGVQFPGRPYCNTTTGECVSERDHCQEMESGMVCPRAGTFPDLTDCRRFISCGGAGEQGVLYNCMYDSVYNHTEKRCRTKSLCYTPEVECAGQYKAITYKPNPNLYVICQGNEKPILKDCGSADFNYDPLNMKCEFKCSEEGHFADPFNTNGFYICAVNGKDLVRSYKICRSGHTFDPASRNCVLKNNAQIQ